MPASAGAASMVWRTICAGALAGLSIVRMTASARVPELIGGIEKMPLEHYVAPARPSLVGMTRPQLADMLSELEVPAAQRPMRVQQLWHWIYLRGAQTFDAMTSVSKELRGALDARYTLARPVVATEQVSVDGTRKWLLRLPGQHAGEGAHDIECVYIPEAGRGTLCVSSQVGCTLNCSFCHTGTQRLVRNLTAEEIVGQILVARDQLGEWPSPQDDRQVTNIVLMGMGEPLYNYDNVAASLKIIMDPEGLSISRRKITLSTSGVV